MEPALPLPLRLELIAPTSDTTMDHAAVAESISLFLSQYAARTGTHNAASSSDDPSIISTASTGGVVAAQLTRLMNGLAGKIDYNAFTNLISGLNNPSSTPTTTNLIANVNVTHTTFSDQQLDQDQTSTSPFHVNMDLDSDINNHVEQQEDLETPVEILESTTDGEAKQSFSKSFQLIQTNSPHLDSSLTSTHLQPSSPSKKTSKTKEPKNQSKQNKSPNKLKHESA